MISSKYIPLEKEVDVVSIDDDDVELKGRKISAFRYRGVKHDVWSWKDMLVELCKIIYSERTTDMLYLASKDDSLYSSPTYFTSPINENCHVWTSSDTRSKKNVILYIFKELGINPSELELELVPLNDNNDSEE